MKHGKKLVSHEIAHQKVTLSEKFSDQVERMTYSVNSQPLSPAVLIIAQWANEQSGDRDGGYAWDQQPGLPLTKADLVAATAEW